MKHSKKSRMKEIIQMAKRDAYQVFIGNRKKFIVLIPMILVFYFNFRIQANAYNSGSIDAVNPSFMDLVIFMFRGKNYMMPDSRSKYQIPIMWLMIQMYIAYLIGSYTSDDVTKVGQQYVIRATYHSSWLIGKIVYCIVSVFTFYLMSYLCIFALTVPFGGGFGIMHEELIVVSSGIFIEAHTLLDTIRGIFILPILTSIVVSVGQMILSLVIKAQYAYIVTAMYMFASSYYVFSYVFIGNYSMLLRNKMESLWRDPGSRFIDPVYACCIDCILLVVFYAIGNLILKKYDYIERV